MIAALQTAYSIDRYRTVHQDCAFGIRQIVDMALRALSPSVNDTTTAVMCEDYPTAILARLASRGIPFHSTVGLLQAMPGTKLYQRLNRQGRRLGDTTGDSADGTTNFLPCMNSETLRQGYRSLLEYIYSPGPYNQRILDVPARIPATQDFQLVELAIGHGVCPCQLPSRRPGWRTFPLLGPPALDVRPPPFPTVPGRHPLDLRPPLPQGQPGVQPLSGAVTQAGISFHGMDAGQSYKRSRTKVKGWPAKSTRRHWG